MATDGGTSAARLARSGRALMTLDTMLIHASAPQRAKGKHTRPGPTPDQKSLLPFSAV
jgi:hypothetical protein